MAKFLFVVLLFVVVAASTAAPTQELEALKLSVENGSIEGQGLEESAAHPRLRRSLCQRNPQGFIIDSGCAASCGGLGSCLTGNCQCIGNFSFGLNIAPNQFGLNIGVQPK